MFLHDIGDNDVRVADHLYRWEHFQLKSGIVIGDHEEPSKIPVLALNEFGNFCVATLERFKKGFKLRRALYDQGGSFLHRMKISGTSFADHKVSNAETIQNARFLLRIANDSPARIAEVMGDDLNDFARLCCTKPHGFWLEKFNEHGINAPVIEPVEHVTLVNNYQPRIPSAPRRPSTEGSLQELESQIEELMEKQTCGICLDRPLRVGFQCGHLACEECSENLRVCHLCRTNIRSKTRLFWS